MCLFFVYFCGSSRKSGVSDFVLRGFLMISRGISIQEVKSFIRGFKAYFIGWRFEEATLKDYVTLCILCYINAAAL